MTITIDSKFLLRLLRWGKIAGIIVCLARAGVMTPQSPWWYFGTAILAALVVCDELFREILHDKW